MDYATLVRAVDEDAALRRKQPLQPAGGKNDKIFPPTYPEERRGQGPRHVFERRRLNGREAWCVLVDSVQSQANRLEEVLLAALRQGVITMPHVSVDFRGAELVGITEITSLDAPHRVYDAILRDSSLDGKPFMKSELGIRLAGAKPTDATALLETSPTALLFGAWHSTGEGGGFGAKFPRTLVSEIIAVDVPVEDGPTDARTGEVEIRTAGRRTGSRIDPLGVLRRVEVFKGQDGWDVVKERAGKGAKQVRPSEINHGNIAPTVRPMTNGSVGAPPVFQHGTFELMGRWNIARDGTGTVSVDFMQGGNIIESDVFRVVSSDAAGTRFWLISTHPTVGGVVVPELVSAEAVRLR